MDKIRYNPLVIGLGANGLGVLRSLAVKNIRAKALVSARESREVYFHTRHGDKQVLPNLDGARVLEFLRQQHDPLLLMPVREKVVLYLSRHRNEIPAHHYLPLPDHEVLETLLNKEKFSCFARQHNLALPRSLTIHTIEQLDGFRDDVRFPMIVKPVNKQAIAGLPKAVIVDNERELRRSSEKFLAVLPEIFIQEFIPGGDGNIYFCLQHINRDGTLTASFVGRKIRQWPPLAGGTASCEPARIPELHQMTVDIFARAGFWGTGSIEYKLDPRTRQFMIIEPTAGRTDFQEYVATANGVNIPWMAWCEANGQPVKPCIKTGGKRGWMHFINDRLARERARPKLTIPAWLWSLRRVRAFDFFSLSDPGPALQYVRTVLAGRFGGN